MPERILEERKQVHFARVQLEALPDEFSAACNARQTKSVS
jgi:hypothetical protein